MSTGRKFRAIPGSAWLLSTEDCVSCPDCAFTFDAMHTTQDGGGYDCPACGENELAAREFALRAALATADQASSALLAERDEAVARAVRAEAVVEAQRQMIAAYFGQGGTEEQWAAYDRACEALEAYDAGQEGKP